MTRDERQTADATIRDREVWAARKRGDTLEELGNRFGLRREKVTQICELARARDEAACERFGCGGVHEPPCPLADPTELKLCSAAASPEPLWVTHDRRYGTRESWPSHHMASQEAGREPSMIDVVEYVPRSASAITGEVVHCDSCSDDFCVRPEGDPTILLAFDRDGVEKLRAAIESAPVSSNASAKNDAKNAAAYEVLVEYELSRFGVASTGADRSLIEAVCKLMAQCYEAGCDAANARRETGSAPTPDADDVLEACFRQLDAICTWLAEVKYHDAAKALYEGRDRFLLPLARAAGAADCASSEQTSGEGEVSPVSCSREAARTTTTPAGGPEEAGTSSEATRSAPAVRCSRCGAQRILDHDGTPLACSLVPGRDGTGGCPSPLYDYEREHGTKGTRAAGSSGVDPDDDGQVCVVVREYLISITKHQDSDVACAAALLLASLFTSLAPKEKS